jgi:hypothetical protein
VPVRKTENRLPPNFQAADFGETVVAPDGRCALVSFALFRAAGSSDLRRTGKAKYRRLWANIGS